jgi:hypothetical protein
MTGNIDFSQVITAEDKAAKVQAAAVEALRRTRDLLLRESDWTQLEDAAPPGGKAAWATYRAALRDLPETVEAPANPVWPTSPIS